MSSKPVRPKQPVQKQLVRGVVKSTKEKPNVKTHLSPSLYQANNVVSTATSSKDKYRVPQVQTTMALSNKIDEIKAKSGPKFKDVSDLTPRSKAVVTERITHQLNFPAEATIYKKLIPVNVNDSVLEEIFPKRKKRQEFTRNKDPEPVLGDYLTPIVPLKLKIEREDTIFEIKPPENFCYNRMYSLFKCLNNGM